MKRINNIPCFRIINKSRDGVIIENPMNVQGQSKMSWAEFNDNFTVVGNVWCLVRTDTKHAKQTSWITNKVRENPILMITLMKLEQSDEEAFNVGYNLIGICEDFRKEFGEKHSDAEVISLVKTCIETLRHTMSHPL